MGSVKARLDLLPGARFNVPRQCDLSLYTGRGHLKIIRLVDRIGIIEHGIDRAVNALAVVYAHAALGVYRNAQDALCAFLDKIQIPDIASGVSDDGQKQLIQLPRHSAEFLFH